MKGHERFLKEEEGLTPDRIVEELDRYIISQGAAKKAVAIALRNRWRRLRVQGEIKDEITPKNIIMIGPTGVGKTEISRRLAKLVKAPFVKVEASKFTEVGYVGRDVESIIRDLAESAYRIVKEEERERVLEKAKKSAGEKILDLLLPGSREEKENPLEFFESRGEAEFENIFLQDEQGVSHLSERSQDEFKKRSESINRTRAKIRELLESGKFEDRIVEVKLSRQPHTHMQIMGPQGFGEIEGQIKDIFSSMVPKQQVTRKVSVAEARKILIDEAQEELIDYDKVAEEAVRRAEEAGIVFIDEIDKICGSSSQKTPDVSREGVQRDLLPLVEGSTVSTKYGFVKTDHILFISSGAFHTTKPSDLMPEFQGRFPIRVELRSLTPDDFIKILTEPENALTKQYAALLETEGIGLSFSEDAVREISELTAEVNSKTEDIGARRLHTLLEKLLEDLSFTAHTRKGDTVEIDRAYVRDKLNDIVADRDLSRFIL